MIAEDSPGGRVTIVEPDESVAVVMPAPRPAGLSQDLHARLAALMRAVHKGRDLGRPGDNAYFVVETAVGYVQGLAPPEEASLRLEARSLTDRQAGDRRLLALGFREPTGGEVNVWVDLPFVTEPDIDHAVAVASSAIVVVSGGDARQLQSHLNIPVAKAPKD